MPESPRALLFDIFGTVVDWRSSVAAGLKAHFAPHGIDRDWNALALAWRAQYQPAMERIRSGARDYVALDVLHRENLARVAADAGLDVSGAELDALTRLWHRLDPWPDSGAGIAALRRRHVVAPLSNGNIALMVGLSRHAGLTWDAILGAEIARAYKPDPKVYLAAAAALDLEPEACMMVAAHNDDLAAARALGMQTAFIPRRTEYGPGQKTDLTAEADWDLVEENLVALAEALA